MSANVGDPEDPRVFLSFAEKAVMGVLLAAQGRLLRKEVSKRLTYDCTEYTVTQSLNRLIELGLAEGEGSTLKRTYLATDAAYERFKMKRPAAAVSGPASLDDAVVALLTPVPQMLNTIAEKIRPRIQSQRAKDALRRLSREGRAKHIDGKGWIIWKSTET